MVIPKKAHLTLHQKIWWQKRIIRHDKWVVHTAKVHKAKVVKFHRAQLHWTKRELQESMIALASKYVSLAGICASCWERVATCESSLGTGHPIWDIDSGNGFYGGLQFTIDTWIGAGGTRFASRADYATREQQIYVASGLPLSNWPVCGASY